MGVDADLNRIHSQFANQRGLLFLDQDRVGLELYVESQVARAPDDREQVLAQQRLAAADGQKEDSSGSHLRHQAFDFVVGQFTQVIVVEVAMHAALVTAPGDIEVNA